MAALVHKEESLAKSLEQSINQSIPRVQTLLTSGEEEEGLNLDFSIADEELKTLLKDDNLLDVAAAGASSLMSLFQCKVEMEP